MSIFVEDNPIVSQPDNFSYPPVSSALGRLGLVVTSRAIESENFVTGASGAGWKLTAEGNLEATSGTFRGALASTSGTIGGWTIGSAALTATGVTIDTNGTITMTTIRTGTTGARVSMNGSTISLFDGSGNNDVTLAAGATDLDITHRGTGNSIDVDYAASGARDTFLMLLADTNQDNLSATSSPIMRVKRTSGSTSIDAMVQLEQEDPGAGAGPTGTVLDIRQQPKAGVAATRVYQTDTDKTAVFVGTNTAATEANRGLLEVIVSSAGMAGVYIAPASTGPHMRWANAVAPVTPVEGQFWYDGTNLKFRDSTTVRTVTWT